MKDFKEAFLVNYFPRETREVKVEEFINLKQGSMSLEEYSFKFTMFYRYAPSSVSNHRDDMNKFVTGVADLVKEEGQKAMLHNDMNLSRLKVYAQYIEEYKLSRISRNFKRSNSNNQNQSKYKKRAPNHGGPSAPKVKL